MKYFKTYPAIIIKKSCNKWTGYDFQRPFGVIVDSNLTLREVSNYGVFSGQHFLVFSPNTEKCGPEKIPYLDIFHAVLLLLSMSQSSAKSKPKNTHTSTCFHIYELRQIKILLKVWLLFNGVDISQDILKQLKK